MTKELVGRGQFHAEAPQKFTTIPRRRLGREHDVGLIGIAVFDETCGQRVGTPVVDDEPFGFQLGGEAAHGGDHQMGAFTGWSRSERDMASASFDQTSGCWRRWQLSEPKNPGRPPVGAAIGERPHKAD